MEDFQQKKRWRSVLESKPVLICLVILLLLFAWGVIGLFNKMQMTRENRRLAENKLMESQKKKEIFSNDVAKLQSQEGIEESIREKFPVVKEGEELIVVVDDKNTPPVEATAYHGFFSFLFFWKNWFK